jgi:hypothetical protein
MRRQAEGVQEKKETFAKFGMWTREESGGSEVTLGR